MMHHHALINGIQLHYVEAGSGPLVLLLHGFPEFWYSWHHQIAALSTAGLRVMAPDLRGYNESDKPAGIPNYRMELLSGDVLGLVRHAGVERAVIVGHDWGGAIAWDVAMRHPEVVEKLIILNAPHAAAFQREIGKLSQLLKSWYIFFFQLPWLPEWAMRRRHFAALERTLRQDTLRRGAFSEEDIQRYKEALARPGALTATINYYRAIFRGRLWRGHSTPVIKAPTLVIWGEKDRYLNLSLTNGLGQWVKVLRIERLPGVSHWAQNDAPERVNELMLDFVRR
jgi:pimeloyl-ACP methyl ester carboxylesterase